MILLLHLVLLWIWISLTLAVEDGDGTIYLLTAEGPTGAITLENLTPGRTYQIVMYAENQLGSSPHRYPTVEQGWTFHEGVGCFHGQGSIQGQKLLNVDLATCVDSCKAVVGCDGVMRKKADGEGSGGCWHRHQIDLKSCVTGNPRWDLHKKPHQESEGDGKFRLTTGANSTKIEVVDGVGIKFGLEAAANSGNINFENLSPGRTYQILVYPENQLGSNSSNHASVNTTMEQGTVLVLAGADTEIYDPNGIITCSDEGVSWVGMEEGTLTHLQSTGQILFCGGWTLGYQCLVVNNMEFVPHSSLIHRHLRHHHTAVVNEKVWLFGGEDVMDEKKGYVIESLEGKKWSIEDTPRTPYEHDFDACSVFTGEALILIGGHRKESFRAWETFPSGIVSKLIPGSRKWESLTPLPAPRENHGCVYLPPNDKFPEGSILVAGGTAGKLCEKCFSDSLLYDISQDSWIPAGEIGSSHARGSLVNIDGRIIFAGGSDACKENYTNKRLSSWCYKIGVTDRVHEFHLMNLGTKKPTWTEVNHRLKRARAWHYWHAAAVIPIQYWNNGKSCKIPNPLPTPSPPLTQEARECLSADGSFFGPEGGRIKAFSRINVGHEINITMSIKPQNLTGMLVGVRGPNDYLILELVNGEVVFRIENGKGVITASLKPEIALDDGNFHEINAIKVGNVVTMKVDKKFALPGTGAAGIKSTDTNNPLFIGGHARPNKISNYPGNFEGCIKDVFINNKLDNSVNNKLNITRDIVYGDVTI